MKFHRTTTRSLRLMLAAGCALAALPLARTVAETQVAGAPAYSPVTDERLANAAQDPGWLMYRHDYTSSGYSLLDRVTASNVTQLKPAWDFKSTFQQGHESAPVVNGDTLFITTPKDEVHAFQASTGRALWTYKHDLSQVGLKRCAAMW